LNERKKKIERWQAEGETFSIGTARERGSHHPEGRERRSGDWGNAGSLGEDSSSRCASVKRHTDREGEKRTIENKTGGGEGVARGKALELGEKKQDGAVTREGGMTFSGLRESCGESGLKAMQNRGGKGKTSTQAPQRLKASMQDRAS